MIIIYILAGILAGITAGFLGVGGGLIFVPTLLFMLPKEGIDPNIIAPMAISTSLTAIVPTTLSSAYRHYQKGTMQLPLYIKISPAIVLGSCLGITMTYFINLKTLQSLLSVFLIYTVFNMYKDAKKLNNVQKTASVNKIFIRTVSMGAIASFFGIGGGALIVPWLSKQGVPLKQAIGTAAVCSFTIACSGVISGIFMSLILPSNIILLKDLGIIYWPAVFMMIPFSVIFARLSSTFAYHVKQTTLHYVFMIFLSIVSLKLLIGSFT